MKFLRKTFCIAVEKDTDNELYNTHSTYHSGDAGLDLFVSEDCIIQPGETVLVSMGVRCQCRSLTFCFWKWLRGDMYNYHSYFLFPRSSIYKTPLIMKNSIGLIDKGYIGTIKAPLCNISNDAFYVKRGQRYVQLVNSDLSDAYLKVVKGHNSTDRGTNGFGSTQN